MVLPTNFNNLTPQQRLQQINNSIYSPLTGKSSGSLSGGRGALTILGGLNTNSTSAVVRAQSIRTSLDQAETEQRQRNILSEVIRRLTDIRTGVREPDAEFELASGFLQDQGRPFEIGFDSNGQIAITAQDTNDYLSTLSGSSRRIYERSLRQIEDAISINNLQGTRENLRANLQFQTLRIQQLRNFTPPDNPFEREVQTFLNTGVPFQVFLDEDAQPVARSQLAADLSHLSSVEQFAVRRAAVRYQEIRSLSDADFLARSTDADTSNNPQPWETQARAFAAAKQAFFFSVSDSGQVTVQSINSSNIIPDFLRVSEDEPLNRTGLPEFVLQAVDFASERIAYKLDISNSGQIEIKENNLNNVVGFGNASFGSENLRGALLTLLS